MNSLNDFNNWKFVVNYPLGRTIQQFFLANNLIRAENTKLNLKNCTNHKFVYFVPENILYYKN